MKRSAIPYSAAEMQWLEANRTMVISDYHRAFVAAFGREDVSAANLHGLRKRLGWKVGRAPDRYKGRGMKYTPVELSWLHANETLTIRELHRQFIAAFPARVDDVTPEKLQSLRKRIGMKTGRTGQFPKGTVPPNKGKKMPYNAASATTQFKKGQRPHTWRGAGHESTDEHGYVWIIVDDINPYTGAPTRRIQKHKWLWEQKNGPVADGHVLKCLDGDKSNTDPSNWEAVPTGLLPRLNGKSGRHYDTAPAQLKPTIMAVAKLEHAARSKGGARS